MPTAIQESILAHLTSRMTHRARDEIESTRLIGSAAALELLGGGQMLVRIDQREPLEVYAFRLPETELERLCRLSRGEPVSAVPSAPPSITEQADDELMDDEPAGPPADEIVAFHHKPAEGLPIEVRCFGGFDVVAGQRDLTLANSPAEDVACGQAAWPCPLPVAPAFHHNP